MSEYQRRYCACGNVIMEGRSKLGYNVCLECGEIRARKYQHCIVPMHKSNYVPITNRNDLIGINVKVGHS